MTSHNPSARRARPLLKWAGGKRQLLPVLRGVYPRRFGRYFEPFAGSAAVFFDLHARGQLAGGARLVDRNADLIACYRSVRDEPGTVIRELERLASGHARSGSAHYYAVRDSFNTLRLEARAPDGSAPLLAAMFLYLNRTGYNGLFRLNSSGSFNVPAGRYTHVRICDPSVVKATSRVLNSPGVSLDVGGFDDIVPAAHPGDFIYFDPPYAPVSATAAFNTYTSSGFGAGDQVRLRDTVVALHETGCHLVVSNSAAPLVRDLYLDAVHVSHGALQLWAVPARRAINSRGDRRGTVDELVLTNVEPDWPATVQAGRLG